MNVSVDYLQLLRREASWRMIKQSGKTLTKKAITDTDQAYLQELGLTKVRYIGPLAVFPSSTLMKEVSLQHLELFYQGSFCTGNDIVLWCFFNFRAWFMKRDHVLDQKYWQKDKSNQPWKRETYHQMEQEMNLMPGLNRTIMVTEAMNLVKSWVSGDFICCLCYVICNTYLFWLCTVYMITIHLAFFSMLQCNTPSHTELDHCRYYSLLYWLRLPEDRNMCRYSS